MSKIKKIILFPRVEDMTIREYIALRRRVLNNKLTAELGRIKELEVELAAVEKMESM